MARVSVVIPCYNRGEYIAATVDSVLAQTFSDLELICVDDGSTDETRAVLEGYGARITLLEHEGGVNKGQSASINLGLAHARGELIAILDSDDLWHAEKLSEQVAFLDANPEIGLVYANGEAVDASERHLYDIYKAGHTPPTSPSELLLDCSIALPSNSLVRANMYAAAGDFREDLRAAQDHDMLVRLTEHSKVGYINRRLWKYRRHGDSISHKNADKRWRIGFQILDAAAQRYPYTNSVIRRRKAVLYFRLAQCHSERGEYVRAAISVLRSGLLDPSRALGVLLRRERVSSPH
ncbi:MAG: glycosyltransferase [Pseudomonadota bacterium]